MYKSSSGGSGMKRERLGDSNSPPSSMSKRSRGLASSSSNSRYDNDNSSDEANDDRRGHHGGSRSSSRRSPSSRRYNNDNDYGRGYSDKRHGGGGSSSSHPYQYKVLCISNLHPKASDDVVRDTLYREFRRYGDISVKVVHEPDERLAFVYFRSAEDAREAKHSKTRIIIYDRPVMVEAAYESAPTTTTPSSYKNSPNRNRQQDFDKYRRSSPVYDNRRDDHHHHHNNHSRYDRPPGPPPPQYSRNDYNRNNRNDDYPPRPPMQQQHYNRYPPGNSGNGPPPPRHMPMHHAPPPPHHHHHQMDHHHHGPPPPPHHHNMGPPPMGGPPPPRYENKKDKFPNYLHHINPEDDPLATRTLFAGNLEVNITEEELRRIFGRYGTVEDIDIKRPPPGTGNAYAFVRFLNLDMASRAKSELSGQYIGKFQCKIGYGKVNPTTKIWIGGLGPWSTMPMLEREFDRFGSIKKIDWAKGEQYAYITYETIDAAQAAVKDMRGYPLGGPDKRLRTDFADASAPPIQYNRGKDYNDYEDGGYDRYRNKRNSSREDLRESGGNNAKGPGSTHSGGTDLGNDTDSESGHQNQGNLNSARSIQDVMKRGTMGWHGALILKTSSFATKLYLTEGDLEGIEALMKDEEGKNQLRITQRLRLDQGKLDDVLKRITSSTSHGIFVAGPSSSTNSVVSSPAESQESNGGTVQSRPLRNLTSYLKQKEAAGVITLVNGKDPSLTGVLYAFPPCPFSWDLIKRVAPNVDASAEKEDHLVIVVIRGGQ